MKICYNEDDVRQLFYAPDFKDIWLKLFCLANSYQCTKILELKKIDFVWYESISSSSWKVKFLLFCFLTAGAKIYCKDIKLNFSDVCACVCIHLCYSMETQGFVALNLSKIEDMQTRLRRNLEAIGMLNQQVSAHTNTHIHKHQVLAVLLPDCYKHTPTHRPTCCWAHTEEEAFMRPTSNTHTHLHTSAHRHPFPLPTIKVKSRQRGGGVCSVGKGGQIVSEKSSDVSFHW